jgi:hypothetical protein
MSFHNSKNSSNIISTRSFTPPTMNNLNQPAIDYLIEAYDCCKLLNDDQLRMAFGKAINAMRLNRTYIQTMEQAKDEVKNIGILMAEAVCNKEPTALTDFKKE